MSITQKLKSKLGMKPRKDISKESLQGIAKMIKEEYPDWAQLNDDILIMLLKFTILQFPKDQFDNMEEQELREKIRNAFINAAKNNKDLKHIATPYEIARLNDAYNQGKKMGVSGKHMLNAVFSKLKKTVKLVSPPSGQKPMEPIEIPPVMK